MTNQLAVIERPHARISPSSFERAEQCTQSVRLSAQAQPRLAGPDARIGTAAHGLLEKCLREELSTFELDEETVQVDGHEVEVDAGMLENVQFDLNWVRANMKGPLLIEKQVRLPFADKYLGSPMFGWIDVATAEGPPWIVADAKFGYNIVEASSVQLALYLLGLALEHYPDLDRVGHAGTTVILQPNARADPVRTYDYSFADLREIRSRAIKALTRIRQQDWTYKFGSWCKFCPACAFCPHLHAVAKDAALTAIAPSSEAVASGEISKEQFEDFLDFAEVFEGLITQVTASAEDYLIHGGKLRNRKLTRRRTDRRWINEAKAVETLKELDVDPYVFKVVSPAEAERRLPRGKRKIVNDKLAEKPLGELTIALKSDPRPEIEVGATLRAALTSSVAADFLAAAKSEPDKGEL